MMKVGDWVTIINSGYTKGKVIEDRGLLVPHGARVYRVLVRRKPKAAYIEVREDQLQAIAGKTR